MKALTPYIVWIKLAAGLAILSTAFTAGWKTKATLVKAAHAEALEAAQEAHKDALEALQEELDAMPAQTIEEAAAVDKEQATVRTITREIIKEVPKYVTAPTPDCSCAFDPGLVGLFNAAASGATPGPNSDRPAPRERTDTMPAGTGEPAD